MKNTEKMTLFLKPQITKKSPLAQISRGMLQFHLALVVKYMFANLENT